MTGQDTGQVVRTIAVVQSQSPAKVNTSGHTQAWLVQYLSYNHKKKALPFRTMLNYYFYIILEYLFVQSLKYTILF